MFESSIIGSFDMPEFRNVLTHWQKDIELLRVLDGDMNCLIGGKEIRLGRGDICLINQGRVHRIYCQSSKSSKFQRLMISPALFTADKAIFHRFIQPVLDDASLSYLLFSAQDKLGGEIGECMQQIEQIEKEKTEAYELLIVALLHSLFQKIYLGYEVAQRKPVFIDGDVEIFRQSVTFIQENYDKKIGLDEISGAGNVSRNKCCALFKKYAQHSPIDYLNLYRLQRSTELLTQTDKTMAEISLMCGFSQQSYFNRLFLRTYGMTPKAYRTANYARQRPNRHDQVGQ